MHSPYAPLPNQYGIKEIGDWINNATMYRKVEDIPDYNNQRSIYVSGRSTTRIPTSAADVASGDRLGDITYAVDGSFQYILVSVSGTLTWARIALDVAW